MANEEHLAILRKGVEAWNEWRKKEPGIRPDLRAANLSKADFRLADFKWTRLEGANLMMSSFELADFSGASLSGAYAGQANFLGGNFQGADLAHSNLEVASFVRANLREAILLEANINHAELYRIDLTSANLRNASLRHADLSDSRLNFSTVDGADLTRARLSGANLTAANLVGTILEESIMGFTSLSNLDLSAVKGLETVVHFGPSSIGIDTIYESQGKVAEVFLRGAGVPEEFITYMRSLVANPIEFYSCFISYSTKDQEFADRLHGDLQNKNVRCWFAPHDVQSGKKLHEQIDQAIRVHEKVLLILSEHSMNSEWVKTEIAKARKREVREKKQVLFPVRLVPFEAIRDWECFDADTGKDSAREIREFFIPDFSEWKNHDKYKQAFERLLKDLKAGKRTKDQMPG